MDDLTKLCADEFSVHIDQLYSTKRIETFSDGPDWVEASVVGLFHRVGDEIAAAALAELSRRALAARARFAIDGPPWAQPLPTSWQDLSKLARICELVQAGVLAQDFFNGRLELMTNFIASLCNSKWDYDSHPSFHRFARGVMAVQLCFVRNSPRGTSEPGVFHPKREPHPSPPR